MEAIERLPDGQRIPWEPPTRVGVEDRSAHILRGSGFQTRSSVTGSLTSLHRNAIRTAEGDRNLLNDFENGLRVPRVGNAVRIREALEELGAVCMECRGGVAVGVDPEMASRRTRSLGGD